ncbi:hypothetical protein PYW08_016216 [Mythimna loreyi]|uniref:Uncharacterized protein n=1 Tax=Mythimna loreyi TaxID=667449 RepID=A0ACC2R0N5_9NEOP|nr:hypothetical protein PYW08_016216 [Mythimna loreyi]
MHKHSFACTYLVTLVSIIHEVLPLITVLDQGIIPLVRESIGIQFFIDIENRHRLGTCKITSRPKMCCLADEDYKDCSLDTIHGDIVEFIEPKHRRTLIHVYPTLYHYDQVGYCDFVIDFKCSHTRRSRQLAINIPFDTQLQNKKKAPCLKEYAKVKGSDCVSLDEDTLHECEPVNCDLKYSGRRPYYDGTRDKCVNAPVCETDIVKQLPDIVYVPVSNICRDLDNPISLGDIYAINTGLGIVTESPKSATYDFKIVLKSNCSTISENIKMLKDMMFGKLCVQNGDTSDYKACCLHAIVSIVGYVIAISGVILAFVCCIQTTMWCYVKLSAGELKQTLMRSGKTKGERILAKKSKLDRELTDDLLKEVIVRDLPIEMRESVVDICHRIDREIKQKKRYRVLDLGNHVNFQDADSQTSETSSESSLVDDTAKLMK